MRKQSLQSRGMLWGHGDGIGAAAMCASIYSPEIAQTEGKCIFQSAPLFLLHSLKVSLGHSTHRKRETK